MTFEVVEARRPHTAIGNEPVVEIAQRFGHAFDIEQIAGTDSPNMRRFIPGFAAYLMTRRPVEDNT